MSHAELPQVATKHLRMLEVRNETRYRTRAIRTLIVRCLRALGLKVRGLVRVAYSTASEHYGFAALGHEERKVDGGYITRSGLNMTLTLPRDPGAFSRDQFARVILHEALHWKGVRHGDMTDEQRYCKGDAPAWCSDIEVAFAPLLEHPKDGRKGKLAHARAMLARAERKLKLATTIEKRWRRRVAAAERAVARAAELKAAAEKKIAEAEGSGEPSAEVAA